MTSDDGSIEDNIHKSTSRLLFGHARAEFEDVSATWRDIERKAQGNVAIAGIFLAATTLVFRELENPHICTLVVLGITILLLAATAIQSIRVLVIAEVNSLEDSFDVLEAAAEITREGNSNEDAKREIRRFVNKRLNGWVESINSIHRENKRKAGKLQCAQYLLIASIVSAVVLMGLAILRV